MTLDGLVKYYLLPLDDEILVRARNNNLTTDFIQHVGSIKLQLDALLQSSYSLIAQIKTVLT